MNTGYAVQSRRIIPELQRLGHEVVIFCTAGLEGAELTYMGVRHLPRGKHSNGADLVPIYFSKEHCDLLVTVQDNWVMPYKIYQHLPWVPWIPVDDDPPSRELVKTLIGTESLEAKSKPTAKKTLVYSKWGVGQLKKVGVESVYVPESVDTSVYIDRGKEESKKKLGFKPEHFVVGVVAANFGYPMRKAFDRMMIGFAKFAENHPNAVLYLHTNADESWRGHDAFDLIGLLKLISDEYPSLVGKVMFPDQYQLFRGISDEKMSEIYSAFDVLLASTGAEGFGLPILEAQSCSRPPIVTDFSSMPELADHGWKVKVKDKMLTGRMSYQVWPDEDDIAEILEYASRSDLKSRGEVCRDFALQFDNKVVADTYWKPLLTSLNV